MTDRCQFESSGSVARRGGARLCAVGLSLLLASCASTPRTAGDPNLALDTASNPPGGVARGRMAADGPGQTTGATKAGDDIVQTSAVVPGKGPAPLDAATSPAPQPDSTPSRGAGVEAAQEQHISLTFARALNQSLLANPDLVALRGRLDVNRAMIGVAKTYPWNPFVQAQFLPTGTPFVANSIGQPASGAGYGNYYIWVMQRFEVAHQRQFRIQGAMAGLDQTQWNIFQGELLNVAQTTRLYFAALYQKEVHELARETAELNENLATVVEQRFKANLARAGDVTTARVAARQSRRQAELTDATYQAALAVLYQQLNLPVPAPLDFEDRLTAMHWCPLDGSREPLSAEELAEGRPDVLAAKAGVSVADAAFRLAKAAMIPDFQAGPIYDTGDDTTRYIGLRFQMNLPVFDTGAPLARQRRTEVSLQQLTYDQLKIRATLEAEAAVKQYERVRAIVLKAALARSVGDELKEIGRQFEAGQADVLAVLTTQNNLLQERRVYLDILNQLAQSAAAVIQATGLPPARIVEIPDVCNAPPGCIPASQP